MKLYVAILMTATGVATFLHETRIAKCAKNVFGTDATLIYVRNGTKFSAKLPNPIVLFNARSRVYARAILPQNYVIQADSFVDVLDLVRVSLVLSPFWRKKLTREGKFLLITADKDLEKKFAAFWKMGIINLVVLAYDFAGAARLLTSDPQAPDNACGLKVNAFSNSDARIQLPKTLRKYTNCNATYLTANTVTSKQAREHEMANFVLKTMVNRFGLSLTTENSQTTVHVRNFFTIGIGYRDLLTNHFYTSIFYSDKMICIVPFPQKIPTMKIVKMIFKTIVWIYVLVTFVAASLTWWFIVKRTNLSEAFLKVFSITLFGSTNDYERSRSMRCLFLAYVVYAIHIQTAFNSKLIEILTIPQYEPRIKSLTELGDSDVAILVREGIYTLFFDHEEHHGTLFNKIKEKMVVKEVGEYSDLVFDINTYNTMAVLLTNNEVELITNALKTEFCILDDFTFVPRMDMAFYGIEGAYILKTIDEVIVLLRESGLLDHFLKGINYDTDSHVATTGYEKQVLTLHHLYFVFVFWYNNHNILYHNLEIKTMSETATTKYKICSENIKQDPEYHLNNDSMFEPNSSKTSSGDDLNITENPIACIKCKVEVDSDYQSCMQEEQLCCANLSPPLVKNEIKLEFVETKPIVENERSQFLCEMCGFNAHSEEDLKSHKCAKSHIRRMYKQKHKCKSCNYTAPYKCEVVRHAKTHTAEKPFKCNLCDYRSNHLADLKRHFGRHSVEMRFGCNMCEYKTHCKSYLMKHVKIHSNEKPFECNKCDYKSNSKSSLASHKRSHSNEKTFKCSFCDYKSKYSGGLSRHSTIHSCERFFSCYNCGYKNHSKSNLARHIKNHSKEKEFKCASCDYQTNYSRLMKVHSMVHSGERLLGCYNCDYKTHFKEYLVKHIRIHSKEKAITCDKCDYRTYSKDNLLKHVKIHSEEKSFKCKLCDFTSRHRNSLKKHLNRHAFGN
ncbi:hypothetical protein FQR65_LT13052 [Abscondita terminalis]|nr:hypothetical protein FQR65_LT13052 [Abscondita terminalis]